MEQEGGLTLLEELLNSNVSQQNVYPKVLDLAQIVLNNVSRWKESETTSLATKKGASNDEDDDDLDYDG